MLDAKFYLFSINLRLYRTCVFDFSASKYLHVSWLFYVQRNILQSMGNASPHALTGLLKARRGCQARLVYVYKFAHGAL